MKKLKNGWMHKKVYTKSLIWTSVVLVAFIAYCSYLAIGKNSNALSVLLFAILGIMVATTVYMYYYSKEIREFSDEVNKVYMSMDPTSFYNYIDTLDGEILADETLCKIAFFVAWFKHFEGKDEEAHALFDKYDTNPFPYPQMYSLKTLIKVYLTPNKEDAYKIIEEDSEAVKALNIKAKLKQQLLQEINGTTVRVDALLGKNVDDQLIEALKGDKTPFENAQNRAMLVTLTKESDPALALAAKHYVMKNSGKFLSFVNDVKDIEIDESLIPDEVEEPSEPSESEEVNEVKEEVKEEVSSEVKATIPLDDEDKKDEE